MEILLVPFALVFAFVISLCLAACLRPPREFDIEEHLADDLDEHEIIYHINYSHNDLRSLTTNTGTN